MRTRSLAELRQWNGGKDASTRSDHEHGAELRPQADPEHRFDPEDVALLRRTAEALRRLADVAVRQCEMNAAYHFGEAEKHLRKAFEREE
jgi:hypothetical protein